LNGKPHILRKLFRHIVCHIDVIQYFLCQLSDEN